MRRFLAHLLAYLCIIAVLFAMAWSFFRGESLIDRIRFYRFDSAVWKSAKPEQRWYMARFLIDHDLLTGKSRSEVESMLGQNPPFYLGPEHNSIIRIDGDWLWIEYSSAPSEATVTKALILSD